MALVPRVALLERLAAPEIRPAIRDGSGSTGSPGSGTSASESDAAVVRSVLFNLRRVLNSREGAAAAQMEFGLPSPQEFFKFYGLTADKLALARPDAIVLHPGPMNRGVEIDSSVADGSQSVILPQVTFGISIRMAVMSILAGN